MTTELLIEEKGTGKIWEISNCTQQCTWTTNRTGSPGKFEFTVNKAGDLSFVEGDTVRFSVDGELVFFGWVFTKSKDRWGVIDVTCYDRLRYLKNSASYAFYDLSAGDMIRQMAADMQVDVSEIEDTGYIIPSLIEQEQSCIDIAQSALEQTLLNTGNIYVLFDDGHGLSLKQPANMISDVIIGEKSLLTDYSYKTDIDQQSYNSVKLVRPNEQTGRKDVFIAQDSGNIDRWGLLQLYQSVDGAMNDAQVKAQAEATLGFYNRRLRTLSVSSLGVPGLRAGQMIYMNVPGLGDINLNQYVLLEKVTHTWENNDHTMDFETLEI